MKTTYRYDPPVPVKPALTVVLELTQQEARDLRWLGSWDVTIPEAIGDAGITPEHDRAVRVCKMLNEISRDKVGLPGGVL